MRLENKVAIVTGAARGIGLATARRFAEEGARVVLGDIDLPAANTATEEIRKISPETTFAELDVTSATSVDSLVAMTRDRFGRLDILVNNAGITADAQLLKMSESDWDRVIDVNLKGLYQCTRSVAGVMIAQGKGKIINAASVVGIYGNFGQTNYVASKAGVIGMTRTWARELGPQGICVNAVAPGFIKTQMMGTIPEKVIAKVLERTPLHRMGTPEDVANAYLFLASDEADFINGAVLTVDGGLIP